MRNQRRARNLSSESDKQNEEALQLEAEEPFSLERVRSLSVSEGAGGDHMRSPPSRSGF